MGVSLDQLPESMRRQAAEKLGTGKAARQAARSAREHEEQVYVVRWVQLCLPELYEHMTAVPLGGLRHGAVAGQLKAEGARPGYPDLLVDLPRGPWHGLRIEMKTPRGRLSAAQSEWLGRLSAAGYRALVAYGRDEAIEHIRSYWDLGPYTALEHG